MAIREAKKTTRHIHNLIGLRTCFINAPAGKMRNFANANGYSICVTLLVIRQANCILAVKLWELKRLLRKQNY